MKKALVVCLAFILMIFTALPCYSEEVDLDSMTEDQLYTLLFQVQEKIYTRDEFSDFVVFSGPYSIGENFEAGTYVFKALRQNGSVTPCIEIYNSPDNLNPSNRIVFDLFRDIDNDKYQYTLKEGQYMVLSNGDFQLFRR